MSNTDVTQRAGVIAGSRIVEFCSKIPADISTWNKLLPNNIGLTLKITRNDPSFSLLAAVDTTAYDILLQDIYLQLARVTPAPSVVSLIENNLQRSPAKIPYKSTVVKALAIPTDSFSLINERLFSGICPLVVIIGIVKTQAQSKYSLNPFNFVTANLKSICVSTNETEQALNTLRVDFANNSYLDTYMKFSKIIGNYDERIINRDTWLNGRTLYAFDLAPKFLPATEAVAKTGNVRLEINFAEKTTEAYLAIVYAIFQNQIYVDKDRNIAFERV